MPPVNCRIRCGVAVSATQFEPVRSPYSSSAGPGSMRIAAVQPRALASAASTGSSPKKRRSEEHTSELQSLMRISYAVFCLNKKHKQTKKQYKDDTKVYSI